MGLDYLNSKFDSTIIDVFAVKFSYDARTSMKLYFDKYGWTRESAVTLIKSYLEMISGDKLSVHSPSFPEYLIPLKILSNNFFVRKKTVNMINDLLETMDQNDDPVEAIMDFIEKNHEFLKWSSNQWLLASPGMNLELMNLPSDLNQKCLRWLEENWGIHPGDEVLQRHVISNKGRDRLLKAGFAVPVNHWMESYFREGMVVARELVLGSEKCKGIIGRGSWIYDPKNYEKAGDGKPFAAFTFLRNDKLSGHRIKIGTATADNEFSDQYALALRDPRRQQLHQAGEFEIEVYAVCYPRDELNNAVFLDEV